jgi:hypothetical protein
VSEYSACFFEHSPERFERVQAYYDNFKALVAIYNRYNAQEWLGCLKRSLNDIKINIFLFFLINN